MKAIALAVVLGFLLAVWLTGGRQAVITYATPPAVLQAQEEARQALRQEQLLPPACPGEVSQDSIATSALQWRESREALKDEQ